MQRAKTLKFTGRYDANGQPDRWFTGVPARDLDEQEVKQLSDEDYANCTGGSSPLYVAAGATAPPKKPAAKRPSRAKKAAPKPAAATPNAPANASAGPAAAAGPEAAGAVPEAPAP